MTLVYTRAAKQDLLRLPKAIARRIVKKMCWFASQKNPLSFARPLRDARFGSYRFRIGNYRVLIDVEGNQLRILIVLAVKHRKDVYKLL